MSTKRKVRERVSIKEAVSLDNEIVVYNDVNTLIMLLKL
jgi:ATP-dependent Clp protease adaptor protein ClpS